MKQIYYVPTADVEPLSIEGSSGPKDWDYGEKSVRDLDGTCNKHGQHVTYFIHPEALLEPKQVALFKELEKNGAELGLHLHPLKWSAFKYDRWRYFTDFGGLTRDETREVLIECIEIFKKAFGYKPRWFSPGTFSFNDHQYAILEELGFDGGRCSLPNREAPKKSAVWSGADPDPHRANGEFRMNKGNLKFVEMPHSVDMSRLIEDNGIKFNADLRIDANWSKYNLDYYTIAKNIVAQLMERNPAVPTIVFVAHNDEDYATPGTRIAENLLQSLEATKRACEEQGIELVPATIADIYDKVMALPLELEETTLSHGGWMGKEHQEVSAIG